MVAACSSVQEALIADKGEEGIEHSQSQSSMHSDSLPAGSVPPGALPASSPSAGDRQGRFHSSGFSVACCPAAYPYPHSGPSHRHTAHCLGST